MRSAREALKSVFKDSEIGQDALDYFRNLQREDTTDNKTEFATRASNVQKLLSDNTRALKPKDYFSTRVVGKKDARITAGLATSVTASIAATGGCAAGIFAPAVVAAVAAPTVSAIGTASVAGLINVGIGAYPALAFLLPNPIRQHNNQKTCVTKINPDKKVNAASQEINDIYKPKMQGYENLSLDYKHVLYEEMTGHLPKNYSSKLNYIEHIIDDHIEVIQKIEAGDIPLESSDLAKEITSFLVSPFHERVEKSRNTTHSSELG